MNVEEIWCPACVVGPGQRCRWMPRAEMVHNVHVARYHDFDRWRAQQRRLMSIREAGYFLIEEEPV